MEKITIKSSEPKEIVDLTAKIREFGESYLTEHFKSRINGKKHLIITAHINDVLAGYLVACEKFKGNSFYCWMAGVDPDYRNKGILKAMIDLPRDEPCHYQND